MMMKNMSWINGELFIKMVWYVMMKSMFWINGDLTLNHCIILHLKLIMNLITHSDKTSLHKSNWLRENNSNIFLNDRISYDEVEKVISKLKNNKACGIDNISYEVLKNNDIHMCLWSLFSKCFQFSCIPSSRSKAIINPIPKSKDRDPYVPPNYREISLLCCISKLYSSLLNNRLTTDFDTLKNDLVKTMHMYFPQFSGTEFYQVNQHLYHS